MQQAPITTDWNQVAQRLEDVRNCARAFAGEVRMHFGTRLHGIRLYGSAARGDWQEDSDVDILVLLDAVTTEDRAWIAERANHLGILGSGILLSAVTLTAADFQRLHDRERLFAAEVKRDGMPI
ncbi:MAG: nucleotidyltransferase domain-containing protein [bacterium]